MAKTARFVDVEQFLVDHLQVGVRVLTRIPEDPKPDEFVRVVRTGGPVASRVSDRATVAVEAFGQSEASAHRLIQACRFVLASFEGSVVGGISVKDVIEVGGPGNLPMPSVDRARYTAMYEIHIRGVIEDETEGHLFGGAHDPGREDAAP